MTARLVADALRAEARALDALADVLESEQSDTALYTTEQAADRLGVTLGTIRRHIADGRLRAVKVGAHWRIPADALADYLRGGGR